MIYGIGTDICAVERIEHILQQRYAERFVKRILTEKEVEKFSQLSDKRKIEFLAGRYALKEAVSKALGTGIGGYVSFLDITIDNNSQGKPICTLSDACYEKLQLTKQHMNIHISLSHETQFAVAYVVIERI